MSYQRASAFSRIIAATLLGIILAALVQSDPDLEADSRSKRFRTKRTERCFMRKINARRARAERSQLRWDRQLVYVGRLHARALARAGRGVSHDPRLGRKVTRWRSLGENTARGGSCRSVMRALWRSPSHRANILGRYSFVGVGVARRNGQIYVQQIFESRGDPGNIYSHP
jgi:uncharacterized protein YkwD